MINHLGAYTTPWDFPSRNGSAMSLPTDARCDNQSPSRSWSDLSLLWFLCRESGSHDAVLKPTIFLLGNLWCCDILRLKQTSTDLIEQLAVLVAFANLAFARTLAVTDECTWAVENFEAQRAAEPGLNMCMVQVADQVHAYLGKATRRSQRVNSLINDLNRSLNFPP